MIAKLDDSILLLCDIQLSFLKVIHEGERVLQRTRFLVEAAHTLGVPIYATEQNPTRMGRTADSLVTFLEPSHIFSKMTFSCCGSKGLVSAMAESGRKQVILCGIETHICVTQTVVQLLDEHFSVFLPDDCLSSRNERAHILGMMRLSQLGAMRTHSESVVYEWMGTAEHPRFKDILPLVKAHN